MSIRKGQSLIPNQVDLPPVIEWTWTRSGGPTEQMFYSGPFDKLQNVIRNKGLKALYDSISIRQSSGEWYRMECARVGDEVTDIHRLIGQDVSQNVAYSLTVRDQLVASSALIDGQVTNTNFASYVSQIADEVRKKQSGQQTYLEMQAAIYNIFGGVANTPDFADDLADDLDRNGDQYIVSQYTYTRSVIVAERVYDANPGLFSDGMDNADRIFTEAQLRAEEDIPPNFRLPPSQLDNSQPSEWLKKPTDADLQVNQKRVITTKYVSADLWSRVRYKLAVL
jgi:hypothetical protein